MSTSAVETNPVCTAENRSRDAMPIENCCLVVQMPSVEEMRREVADITCQMQSVYFNDLPSSLSVEVANDFAGQKTESSTLKNQHSEQQNTSYPKFNNISGLQSDMFSSNATTNTTVKYNSLGRTNLSAITDGTTDSLSTAVSLPREVQVSEEFEINGKRYRQTYQKRVVLERQTTRDIFLLPASSNEGRPTPSVRRSLEYTSPNFPRAGARHKLSTGEPVKEPPNRPGLDLTVIRYPLESQNQESGIAPAVVMCATRNAQQKRGSCKRRLSNASLCGLARPSVSEREDSPSHLSTGDSKFDYLSAVKTDQREHPRGKLLTRELFSTIRKHVTGVLNRSKSARIDRSKNSKNTRNVTEIDPVIASYRIDSTVNPICYPTGGSASPSREIVGYMFQFGAWDNNAPVLDPRLPIAYNWETDQGKTGVVHPNPAEWHHTEVGSDPSVNGKGPLVRGRIVACLQRFTQNSSTSGKTLHRSTYVQQTRLVRQYNKQTAKMEYSSIGNGYVPTRSFDIGLIPASSALTGNEDPALTPPPMKLIEMSADGELIEDIEFPSCGNERLQLLQSLCPAAAAATILLGRRFRQDSASDLDDNENETNSVPPNAQGMDLNRITVKANSWCAPALIAEDLSDYLLFHREDSSDDGDKRTTEIPHLLLKGGTLDGLIMYALHFLQSETEDPELPLDRLFPHVFRITYPTFATAEQVLEKLIQIYVAFAPVEPGCLSIDWKISLTAAEFLVTLVREIPPEHLTARLVLRLARFARLLMLDEKNECERQPVSRIDQTDARKQECRFKHKALAESLLDGLPLLSASAQLRERVKIIRPVSVDRMRKDKFDPINKTLRDEKSAKEARTIPADVNLTNTEHPDSDPISPPGHMSAALRRTEKLLTSDAHAVATELTRMEEKNFSGINFQELLDIDRLEHGEAPTLGVCVEHFNRVTLWARSQLFVFGPKLGETGNLAHENGRKVRNDKPNALDNDPKSETDVHKTDPNTVAEQAKNSSGIDPNQADSLASQAKRTNTYCIPVWFRTHKSSRMKQITCINLVFCQLCEVLKHLKALRNFSSFLAILLAVQDVPENLLLKRSRSLLDDYLSYMRPPMFSEYRRDLESASLPYLPYLGLIFQQLIHLDAGNPIYLSENVTNENAGNHSTNTHPQLSETASPANLNDTFKNQKDKFINVWRCWKHYLILGYFVKRREAPDESTHKLECDQKAAEVLNQLEDRVTDAVLKEAKYRLTTHKKTA